MGGGRVEIATLDGHNEFLTIEISSRVLFEMALIIGCEDLNNDSGTDHVT